MASRHFSSPSSSTGGVPQCEIPSPTWRYYFASPSPNNPDQFAHRTTSHNPTPCLHIHSTISYPSRTKKHGVRCQISTPPTTVGLSIHPHPAVPRSAISALYSSRLKPMTSWSLTSLALWTAVFPHSEILRSWDCDNIDWWFRLTNPFLYFSYHISGHGRAGANRMRGRRYRYKLNHKYLNIAPGENYRMKDFWGSWRVIRKTMVWYLFRYDYWSYRLFSSWQRRNSMTQKHQKHSRPVF